MNTNGHEYSLPIGSARWFDKLNMTVVASALVTVISSEVEEPGAGTAIAAAFSDGSSIRVYSCPFVVSVRAVKNDSIGQLIMTGVPGKELDPATAGMFRRVQPGAFILFGRNIETPAQLRKLIDD